MATYTIRDVDDRLWSKVKELAATRGISIKQLIIDLLRREVEEGSRRLWKESG